MTTNNQATESALQSALKASGLATIYETPIGEIKDSLILGLLAYGIQRKRNDSVNGDISERVKKELETLAEAGLTPPKTPEGKKMSPAQVKAWIESETGIDFEEIKKNLEKVWVSDWLAGKLGQGRGSREKISEAEVNILRIQFLAKGFTKASAGKAAKAATRWTDLARLETIAALQAQGFDPLEMDLGDFIPAIEVQLRVDLDPEIEKETERLRKIKEMPVSGGAAAILAQMIKEKGEKAG